MEDKDFGGIIFYIIAAIIGIVGSFAGKKKKQAESQIPDFESVGDSGEPSYERGADPFEEARRRMEETIRRMTGEFPEMDIEEEGSYEEPMAAAVSSEGVSALSESLVTEKRFEELLSSTATYKGTDEDNLKSVDDHSIGSDIASEFDLRKAIIFSEILKPRFSSY